MTGYSVFRVLLSLLITAHEPESTVLLGWVVAGRSIHEACEKVQRARPYLVRLGQYGWVSSLRGGYAVCWGLV